MIQEKRDVSGGQLALLSGDAAELHNDIPVQMICRRKV